MTVGLPRHRLFTPPPRALLVDVGLTLTSYDGARIAAIAGEVGVSVGADAVDGTERALRAELAQHSWAQRPGAPAGAGARFYYRILELAGAEGDSAALARAAERLWTRHLEKNLWCRVLAGVTPALQALRRAGLRMAVLSNSEGTLEAMLADVGLAPHFDAIVDSWVVGVAKPDPRIFALALERIGVVPAEAVMVGDSPAADVAGAEAAGVRAALVDPFDLHSGASAARFASFAGFAEALLAARGR